MPSSNIPTGSREYFTAHLVITERPIKYQTWRWLAVPRVRKGVSGDDCRVIIEGGFTFDLFREFLNTIDERSTHCDRLIIDLTRSDYMDSSAGHAAHDAGTLSSFEHAYTSRQVR
jgi:hypothetical protein